MIPSFLSLMSSANFKGIPPSVFTALLLNAAMLQLPSVLAKRGDHRLAPTRDLARIRDGSRRNFQFVSDSLRLIADIKGRLCIPWRFCMNLTQVKLQKVLAAMQVTQSSRAQALLTMMRFDYRVRLFSPRFIAWFTGSQHWRARGSTSSISTSHYPAGHQYHVVQEQGR
jgi:hypothetical protein